MTSFPGLVSTVLSHYCVFHGFLPPNPREGCHPVHSKAATAVRLWVPSSERCDAGGTCLRYWDRICQPALLFGQGCSCQPVCLVMPSWREKHVLRFPAGRAADDEQAPHFQGAQTMADIPLVVRESTYQFVMT